MSLWPVEIVSRLELNFTNSLPLSVVLFLASVYPTLLPFHLKGPQNCRHGYLKFLVNVTIVQD